MLVRSLTSWWKRKKWNSVSSKHSKYPETNSPIEHTYTCMYLIYIHYYYVHNRVTSSEKVDKENRYSDFTVISLPYPGCEFFREFRDNNYTHESLVFDWSQTHVNADITIPTDTISSQLLHINWDQYKVWDLVTITQNYLKLCLKYLQDNNSGLLIHCISGWDRTPLFISLLRMSLWADGVVHQSLNAQQMIFLTVAYDWFLFGHDLPDRLTKGEDIFMFCFYALKYITEEDFSIVGHRYTSHTTYITIRSTTKNIYWQFVIDNFLNVVAYTDIEVNTAAAEAVVLP